MFRPIGLFDRSLAPSGITVNNRRALPVVLSICSSPGADIEATAKHPVTDEIYAFTGERSDGADKKKLIIIDKHKGIPDMKTGLQLDIGAGKEFQGASFNPVTGELWAAGDNVDLRIVNTEDGTSAYVTDLWGNTESLAWDETARYLYIYRTGELLRYDTLGRRIEFVCPMAEDIEGLEFDRDRLILGYHHSPTEFNVDIFDVDTCETLESQTYNTPAELNDVESMTFDHSRLFDHDYDNDHDNEGER